MEIYWFVVGQSLEGGELGKEEGEDSRVEGQQ